LRLVELFRIEQEPGFWLTVGLCRRWPVLFQEWLEFLVTVVLCQGGLGLIVCLRIHVQFLQFQLS